jgi:hypothetical protein
MAQKFGNGRWFKDGFLDNRETGHVVGRMTFAAQGPVDFFLTGDFRGEIAGKIIRFHNPRFIEEDLAVQVLADFEIPQLGEVGLISFDPHPLLPPHPYIEWFSCGNHYRIELAPGDAWIVTDRELTELDTQSHRIRQELSLRVQPASGGDRDHDDDY